MKINPTTRFLKFVNKTSCCWLWTGGTFKCGYGKFRGPTGKTTYAHRFSYEINVGNIPENKWVLHSCDVRLCVNPNHLWIGDRKDNMEDASKKGRVHPKLTLEQVDWIRKEYPFPKGMLKVILKKLGISKQALYYRIFGRSRSH